jgi:2-iminobutanoate/2-iminopropanoate deaminase
VYSDRMNDKKVIRTSKAPQAVGPYIQGVSAGGFLYVSGQIPLDPATGLMVEGDIRVQTQRVMENLKGVAEAAGLSLSQAVKCTCYLKEMEHFDQFNAVYAKYFLDDPPARECVEVARLPRNALVEVSAILQTG